MAPLLFLSGCQQVQQQPKPKPVSAPAPKIRHELSPELKQAIMMLVYARSDPNVFKIRQKDPFKYDKSDVKSTRQKP